MTHDPVCGALIDEHEGARHTIYNGEAYYFCSENCQTTFNSHPEMHVDETEQDPSMTYGNAGIGEPG